jgi:hypothetical protein
MERPGTEIGAGPFHAGSVPADVIDEFPVR